MDELEINELYVFIKDKIRHKICPLNLYSPINFTSMITAQRQIVCSLIKFHLQIDGSYSSGLVGLINSGSKPKGPHH